MVKPLWQLLLEKPSSLTCDECFAVMEYYAELLAAGETDLLPNILEHLEGCPNCELQHREALRRLAAGQLERSAAPPADPTRSDGVQKETTVMIAFGPVPSRRLGRSLGINNIPPKICTYSCVYCQLGRTLKMEVDRCPFYEPEELVSAVRDKVANVREAGESIDYLTFVPDGEPTLDIQLGREIELLRPLGLPIAVISNASLIWRQDVREELMAADWVSLKVDAVGEETWRQVDRPYGRLKLAEILEGALEFAQAYGGRLATETMLVAGINDREEHMRAIAGYLADLQPSVAYLSVPTRPPAERWAHAPSETSLNRAYQLLTGQVGRVEYLIGYEGNAFAFTGDVEQDLLAITAVHPMREDAVSDYLARAGAEWKMIHQLVAEGTLVEAKHDGHSFYLRKVKVPGGDSAHEWRR